MRISGLLTTSIVAIFLCYNTLEAQLSVTSVSTNFTIDFESTLSGIGNGEFNGSGFTPTPSSGQLDSDGWRTTGFGNNVAFGSTATSGDAARGTDPDGVSSGGVYAFEHSTGNVALGVQPAGSDFTPGTITLLVTNNTGATVTSVTVSYNILTYNDQGRANSLNFSYSTDDNSYTNVSALDYTTTETADVSPSWTTTARNTTITGLSLANGSSIYLQWTGDDVSGSGSRDQYAIDDIVINMAAASSVTTYSWGGSWSPSDPSGTSTSSDSIVVSATGASLSSATSCKALVVEPGASLDLGANVLTVADTAFIQAGSGGYGQVIGNISGTSQVQSYRTGSSAAWLNVAFSVDATLADVSGVTVNATGNASTCNIYRFDATTDGDANDEGDWVAISSPGAQTENIGYQLYVDNGSNFGTFPLTIATTGTLLDGNQDVSVSNAQTNAWNLIPNPYASTVEWNLFRADGDNSELANTTYYIQDGNPSVGSIVYRSYNGTAGANGGSNDIPPGQSFFVLADGTGNLTFKNSFRNVTGTTGLYKATSIYSYLKLKASANQTGRSDESVLGFDGSFSPGKDHNFDGSKRRNNVYPNLFTKSDSGEELTYNGISDHFQGHSEVLYFECSESGDYTIELNEQHLPSGWTVELEDQLTGIRVDLGATAYVFTHSAGNIEDRFVLHITQQAVGVTEGMVENSIYAYVKGESLLVNLSEIGGEVALSLYDLNGRLLVNQLEVGQGEARLNLSGYAHGVYVLRVHQGQQEVYSQKIIK